MADLRSPRPPVDTRPAEPDASLGELLGRLSTDFGDLVSTQVELAKVELKESANRAAQGAGMFAGAAVGGLLALTLLSFAAAWGLAEVMAAGWAFLIVGVIWLAITGVLAMGGKQRFERMKGIPETQQSIKEDVAWARQPTS
jgi:uncharacterized membrane protein YqjE